MDVLDMEVLFCSQHFRSNLYFIVKHEHTVMKPEIFNLVFFKYYLEGATVQRNS